jgi:heptosyltransferase-2
MLPGVASFVRSIESQIAHYTLAAVGNGRASDVCDEKRRQSGFTEIDRILICRLDEIGDVVLSTPFLRELRHNAPRAKITLLVKPAIENLVSTCPYVDSVMTYQRISARYFAAFQSRSQAAHFARNHLSPANYDLAVYPRWDVAVDGGQVLTYLSGARRRVGYSEYVNPIKRSLNSGADRMFTDVLNEPSPKHEVQRNLDLLRFLGGRVRHENLALWLGKQDERGAEILLEQHGVGTEEPLVAIAPGAGSPRRRWPLPNYAELALWLRQHFAHVVVVGGDEDISMAKELVQRVGPGVVNAVGQLTLRQTAALLRRCRLFIGNDTGPMHMAAAVGVPVVEISCHPLTGSLTHANSPVRFGPWGVPHRILRPLRAAPACENGCNSNEPHCIVSVFVDQVKRAVRSLVC